MTVNDYPILRYLDENELTSGIYHMLDDSGYDEKSILDIEKSFKFFAEKKIDINHISPEILSALEKTPKFIRDRSLLENTRERAGLLLLPRTVLPDFSNVPAYVGADPQDYPIDAILYSWLSYNNHDIIAETFDPEDIYRGEQGRSLLIIPICGNRITQATNQFCMTSNDEIYGWPYSENEGRHWYGQTHDMVMSLILLNSYSEVYDQIITERPVKRKMVVCNDTDIEMIY